MRLSEIMSQMDLSVYPQLALILFFVVFAGVAVRVFSKKRAKEYEKAAQLPLDEA